MGKRSSQRHHTRRIPARSGCLTSCVTHVETVNISFRRVQQRVSGGACFVTRDGPHGLSSGFSREELQLREAHEALSKWNETARRRPSGTAEREADGGSSDRVCSYSPKGSFDVTTHWAIQPQPTDGGQGLRRRSGRLMFASIHRLWGRTAPAAAICVARPERAEMRGQNSCQRRRLSARLPPGRTGSTSSTCMSRHRSDGSSSLKVDQTSDRLIGHALDRSGRGSSGQPRCTDRRESKSPPRRFGVVSSGELVRVSV